MIQAIESLSDLYEADETAWLETMAEIIERGDLQELDYPNLREFLTDMAKRDRKEVRSRLVVLLVHWLKWTYQKKKRSGSWRATIIVQTDDLQFDLASRTLRNYAEKVLPEAYKKAVRATASETRLPLDSFPKKCPWTVDMLLSEELIDE